VLAQPTTRLSIAAFAALVLASIGAFFVTQHLKVTTPLIQGAPRPVPGVINPLHPVRCGKWNSGSTTISFYLQHRSDDVIVSVVDSQGDVVRTVADGRHMRKDVRHPDGVFYWNGRLADGTVARDGTYHFRVTLIHQNRTIDLTTVPVRVKTVPPRPVITSIQPRVITTPGTRVTIRYAGNEGRGGTILLYRLGLPGGPRLIKSFLTPWKGQSAVWDGTVRQGRPAPAGTYLVALEVTDAACNTGRYAATNDPVTVQ
jgi:flagellar hook assembly protein FlgD